MDEIKSASAKELSSDVGPPTGLVLWVLRVVAVIAAAVSGYLAWVGLFAEDVAGCGGMGMNCANVLASGWAKWFGIPVGVLATSLYLSLAGSLSFAGPIAPARVRRLAWRLSTWMIYAAAAAGVWFMHLQWLAVDDFCPWCMSVHACAIGMAMLAMAAGQEAVSQKVLAVGVALAAVAVLAAGQLLGPQPAHEMTVDRMEVESTSPRARWEAAQQHRPATGISTTDLVLRESPPEHEALKPPVDSPPDNDPEAMTSATANETGDPPSRLIGVYVGGEQVARVDAYQHPILGSPEAEHVVVKLFDYTCGHCRELHGHLVAARKEFGDDFAVLMLPVPMNPDCNQHVVYRRDQHADACQLAALALGVWQADATKFEEFDRWLFEPEHPPRISEARAKAVRLVGKENLESALGDWRLSERMVVGIELYRMAGAGPIPKILTQNTKLTGGVHDRAYALKQLARELGIN